MLLNLINDLLDFAKIQNQKFCVTEKYFDFNQLVWRAFKSIEIQANQKFIALEYDKKIMISQNECQKSNIDY